MKNTLIKKHGSSVVLGAVMAAVMLLMPEMAFADLAGGMAKANSEMSAFVTAVRVLVGTAALGYLLWKAIQAWQGRCEITEFLMSAAWVAVAGGVVLFAPWLFNNVFS